MSKLPNACLALLFALTAVDPSSAEPGGAWTAYTSMRQLTDLVIDGSSVWAISPGGVLRLDRQAGVYHRYTRLDGLASNRVSSLTVDERGDLWFGTTDLGVSRFHPETGRFDDPLAEFEGRQVGALADWGEVLFVGTERGVSAYLLDKEEVKETYRQLGKMPKDTAVQALLVHAGQLWVGTPRGLAWASLSHPNLQDPDSWQTLTSGGVNGFLVASDTLFCATENGVWTLDPATGQVTMGLTDSEVLELAWYGGYLRALGAEGRLWRRLESGEWAEGELPMVAGARALTQVAPDSALWLATDHGLQVVGGPPPPVAREPASAAFYDLATGPDGRLWVASVPKDNVIPHGLYALDGTDWQVLGRADGLSSEYVASVAVDPQGQVWAGTWGRGLDVRDTTGVWHHLDQTNSVLRGTPTSASFVAASDLDLDPAGNIWVMNVQAGLAVLSGFPPARGLLYANPTIGLAVGRDGSRLSIGPDGLKWLATPLDGFLLFDDGGTPFDPGDEQAQAFSTLTESRLTSNRVADILAGTGGRVWVATDNGLHSVRGTWSRVTGSFAVEEWRVYTSDDGLPTNEITALAEDADGRIWVGTAAGLAQITRAGEVAFSVSAANSGLIEDRVNSLCFDPRTGYLWIGTANGLSRLVVDQSGAGEGNRPRAFPNPFLLGARGTVVTLAGLPLGADLRIYGLDGTLVASLEGRPGQDALEWNGENADGFLVGSGIYLFVAEDESGTRVHGRFAVINGR
ncbi:MAG: two-component regulator propeller domain-containing protein [Candidatus Latescibacterota bacterium]|jgi:ligand-binding sensor domain-containing protein